MPQSFPSGLAGSIEEFQVKVKQIRERSEEIDASSRTIFDTDAGELDRKFTSLLDELEVLSSQVRMTSDLMESIHRRWRSDGGYL